MRDHPRVVDDGGGVVGWVTSGGYSHHMDTSVAMGCVPARLADALGQFRSRFSAFAGPLPSSTAVSGTLRGNE